ncbi:MAG: Maf family protein [Gammaproteobacteria bacterium]|nr:Maf family protein [Gammaproteobacteria bacterium]
MTPEHIVLASSSPRRAALLRQARIPFRVQTPDVDETAEAGESGQDYVTRLARTKARAVRESLPVVAADTVVTIDGQLLGKPRDKPHFVTMMRTLSGREHRVLTAVALRWGVREAVRTVGAMVTLRHIAPAEIDAYWSTGEPQDKAGGYGIQGLGGTFVRMVHGSYHAVVGLPLAETEELLAAFGIDAWHWRTS